MNRSSINVTEKEADVIDKKKAVSNFWAYLMKKTISVNMALAEAVPLKDPTLIHEAMRLWTIVTQSTEDLEKTAGKDEATWKMTYPKLLGMEKLNMEAKEQLDDFSPDKASSLVAMVDYIAYRQN